MHLSLIAIGRARAGPVQSVYEEYAGRIRKIGPGLGFRSFDLLERPESRASTAAARVEGESRAVMEVVQTVRTAVLDERGQNVSSAELARWLGHERDSGTAALAFVIGGPDGLSDLVRRHASSTIAFGRVTWPHHLVRALLVEQIYRALTILGRHPYHRT